MDRHPFQYPPTRPIVLLVEGHEDTRALYSLALFASGFDVVPAQDGTQAHRRAAEIHPDIIVADLPIPNDDGGQFLHDLKQDPRTRDIPVVGVSVHTEQSLPERPDSDGFAAFLRKPCLPDELAAGLRQLLGSQTRQPVRRR